VVELLAGGGDCSALIGELLGALDRFTGEELEQEDDITLVALRRSGAEQPRAGVLADFTLASEPGNEREAMRRVAAAAAPFGLEPERLERLKTATAEATMNAMEHGNGYHPDLDVQVTVSADARALTVAISDCGGARAIAPADAPDIDAKLDGRQSPRGWGLFLIERMVDELRQRSDGDRHTVELVMHLEGGRDAKRDA
jgi:anti-sigma regulatory factor (Ser/Thr protein kinase)